jgi:prophage DNA circulation protein
VPAPDIFEQYGFPRYTPRQGVAFLLRATMVGDVFERRVVTRKQPYLEGPAPCDDTGPENDTFDVGALFARSDDVFAQMVGEPVYPDYHARFLRDIRVEGTGTLYFPGRGELRVRLKRRTSQQVPEERDAERVVLSFIEDGEDGRASADSFTLPSAKSAGPVLVRQFGAAAAQLGFGGDLLQALEDFMAALEAAVNDPFNSAGLVPQRAQRVLDVCKRIRRVHTRVIQTPPAFSPLLPPGASSALTLIAQIEDTAAAQKGAIFGTASIRPRRFSQRLSIFEIAVKVGQPVDELIRLNAGLPLFGIPAGVEVLTKAA